MRTAHGFSSNISPENKVGVIMSRDYLGTINIYNGLK
jgi:hypothetical protein